MKQIYILFSIILLSTITVSGQVEMTTHFMRNNPWSSDENPASLQPFNGYVGIPALSSVSFSLTNTAFHYNRLLKKDSDGYPATLTLDRFVKSLHKEANWLNFTLNEEILSFGIRHKMLFFSFSYRIKAEEFFNFSEDIFAFPVNGNISYLGEDNPARMKANISVDAYQEFGFGVQAMITDKLFIGARPKLLMGLANVKTNKLHANIFTSPDTYNITMNYEADVTAVSAWPSLYSQGDTTVGINFNEWKNIFNNFGFAIDLGGSYQINEHFGVAAAVNNIGFIHWNTPGVKISSSLSDQGQFYNEGNFFFDGMNPDQIIDLIEDQKYLQAFIDTLIDYFPLATEDHISSYQWLNPRFLVEGYYQINPQHRFSALFQGTIVGKNFYPRFMVAYSGLFGRVFELCVNYSLMPSSYTNIGVGVGFNWSNLYLYAATDNIFGIVTPLNSNSCNLRFGMLVKWDNYSKQKKEARDVQRKEKSNANKQEKEKKKEKTEEP